MRILLTGAAGFIGSHLCEQLLGRGDTVLGLDSFDDFYDPAIKRRNLQEAQTHPQFRLVEGDIRNGELLEQIFAEHRFDCVIHLGARAGVRPSIAQPLLYQDVNLRGTNQLLEAMRKAGCRKLVFASSSSVYGNNSKVPFSEKDPVDHPISPYAATKKAGELMCHSYHHLFGMACACLRFFTVYGPRQRPEMGIAKFVRSIDRGEELVLFGDGSSRRDYTWIEDILQGITKVLDSDFSWDVVNLGESRTTTLIELVGHMEKALGKKARLRHVDMQPGDVLQTFADLEHARRTYGYDPQTTVAKGIPDYVDWYRAHS